MENFSVDHAGLYVNWASMSLFVIPGTFPTLNLPVKSHSALSYFSDAILVSNCHGFKGETTKVIPYYMIDFISKAVKPSHLRKITYHTKNKQPNVPIHLCIF